MRKPWREPKQPTPPPIYCETDPRVHDPTADFPIDVGVIDIQDAEAPGAGALVACLSSAVVHLLALVTLGLLVVGIKRTNLLEIQLSVANTSATVSLQTVTVELERSPVELPELHEPLPPVPDVDLKIETPILALATEPSGVSGDGNSGGKTSNAAAESTGTFFGAEAYGNRFVYVVDMSVSMGFPSQYGQTRFEIACDELVRSINQLNPTQSFCVVVFCYRTRVMLQKEPQMYLATAYNKERATRWIRNLGLGPGTDPRYGTMVALELHPDAIFLLSDGEFNGRSVNTHRIRGNPPIEAIIEQHRDDPIPIHSVALEDVRNRKRLRRISLATGGTHRFVGRMSRQDLLLDDLRSKSIDDVTYGLQSIVDGSQAFHDTEHLKAATKLIARLFKSPAPSLREAAHLAMVKLADGEDLGPDNDDATSKDYLAAQKSWTRYWNNYFRENHSR